MAVARTGFGALPPEPPGEARRRARFRPPGPLYGFQPKWWNTSDMTSSGDDRDGLRDTGDLVKPREFEFFNHKMIGIAIVNWRPWPGCVLRGSKTSEPTPVA